MEIFYLRGSPWSLRLIWALNILSPDNLADVEFTALQGADKLKTRIKAAKFHKAADEENTTITLPVMFYTQDGNEYVIRNAIDIFEYFCEGSTSDMAANFMQNKAEIFEIDEKLNRVCRYCRNLFFAHGSDFAYYLAPSMVAYIPGMSSLVGRFLSYQMGRKYKEIGSKYTVDEIEEWLSEFNERLANDYLFGETLSYNDITLLVVAEFMSPTRFGNRPLSFQALNKAACIEIGKLQWATKFKNIMDKRDWAFENLLDENTVEACYIEVKRDVPQFSGKL